MKHAAPALAMLALFAASPAFAGQYVPPPIMPVPDAWQGRSQAQIRVLDKLDAHIETLTLKPGETGRYKSLAVTVRSCMDRPDGMPRDSAAFLDIQDEHGDTQPFTGWTFSREPAIGVFESPVYAVELVDCQGDPVAPMAPPLPAPVPPPASMAQSTPDQAPPDNAPSDNASPDDASTPNQPADQPAGQAPDAVYPDGTPPPPQPDPQPQYQPQPSPTQPPADPQPRL